MNDGQRIWAIADDLTGAAEIAGVAFRREYTAAIVLDGADAPTGVDVVVYDSDSRLLSAEIAAQRVHELAATALVHSRHREARDPGHSVPALPGTPTKMVSVYKKTDSVLRGNVRAEIESLANALGRPRVLLVPANPSAGRMIRNGVYLVRDIPLAETEFARDPHHPARSSIACELLGPGAMTVTHRMPGSPLPVQGIIVGDAVTSADVAQWAERVDATTLPSGGREFFEVWLEQVTRANPRSCRGDEMGMSRPSSVPPPCGGSHGFMDSTVAPTPALVISGSVAEAARGSVAAARAADVPVLPIPADYRAWPQWINDTAHALTTRHIAFAVVDRPYDPDSLANARFTAAFAQLAQELFTRRVFQHVILEGGATAAAVLRALKISCLHVTGEWAPGVVALTGGGLEVTMKPGSYPWPEKLTRRLRG